MAEAMDDALVDAIVVGSGPAGVNAAFALVEGGRSVLMLDVGFDDARYTGLLPPLPFAALRRTDAQQHRYLLGDDFEGIQFGDVGVGAQLTPPRAYMTREVARLAPVRSDTFTPMESLALGGLGVGWGAVAAPYSDEELADFPITRAELAPHYDAVAKRIGVSGARDDLLFSFGDCDALLPPLELDTNAATVLARYERRREALNARGFHLGRSRLAVCTVALDDRGPHAYRDMDFWSDDDRSVYRPKWTVDALRRRSTFRYLGARLVRSFAESNEDVTVTAQNLESGELERHRARALVLAAGTLGTARVVLRSRHRYGVRLPLLCNPYTYAPTVNLAMLGSAGADRRHSLAQLAAVCRAQSDSTRMMTAQFYSYRSLLTFRLMREVPLPYREGLRAMSILMPTLAILGLHHADRPTPDKYCLLRPGADGGADVLEIAYSLDGDELRAQRAHERQMLRAFRLLGCWAIGLVRTPFGASIRYAGTLPMRASGDDLTCDAACRLRGTRAVFVVDGSVFPTLPAKGLTYTMMANANRVGVLVAESLG